MVEKDSAYKTMMIRMNLDATDLTKTPTNHLFLEISPWHDCLGGKLVVARPVPIRVAGNVGHKDGPLHLGDGIHHCRIVLTPKEIQRKSILAMRGSELRLLRVGDERQVSISDASLLEVKDEWEMSDQDEGSEYLARRGRVSQRGRRLGSTDVFGATYRLLVRACMLPDLAIDGVKVTDGLYLLMGDEPFLFRSLHPSLFEEPCGPQQLDDAGGTVLMFRHCSVFP